MERKNESANLPVSGFPVGMRINPECELSYENGDDLETLHMNCTKNPGHPSFIRVDEFQMSHLPEEYQTPEMVTKINGMCGLTVKILIKYISLQRPDSYADSDQQYPYSGKMRGSKRVRRYGTGFVQILDADGKKSHVQGEKCPCPECKDSNSPCMEYWTLLVGTATHVIYDDSEAACAVIECFFDSEDRAGVKTIYGLSLKPRSLEFDKRHSDACFLICVTHDGELFKKLHELCCNYHFVFSMNSYDSPIAYLISHPHGCSKRITFGKLLHITVPVDSEIPVSEPIMFDEGTFCRLPLLPWSLVDGKEVSPVVESDLPDVKDPQQSDSLGSPGFHASEEKSDQATFKGREEEESDKEIKSDENTSFSFPREGAARDMSKTGSQLFGNPNLDEKSNQAAPKKEKDSQESKTDKKYLKTEDTLSEQSKLLAPIPEKELQANTAEGKGVDIKDEPNHKSPPSNDYSHLGATSLSFQEPSSNTDEDVIDPTHLTTEEDSSDGEEWIPGSVFSSLFGENIPQGAVVILSPELEYYLKSCVSGPNTKTEFSLQPGKEFNIPFGTTFTLPPMAKFSKRFASLIPGWFTLPPGSKLTLPDGKDVPLPMEAEFLTESLSLRFGYATYDMATCPGSSGAIIHQEGVGLGLPFGVFNFSHFGTMSDTYSRSGLQNLYLKL